MAKAKSSRLTKKDLESKIRALESKIEKLSASSESAKTTKPASAGKTLPKGTTPPPPPSSTPPPPPPSSTPPPPPPSSTPPPQTKSPPVTLEAALEESWRNSPITDTFGELRAKITGYTPSPSRYYARNTAPVGKVPTSNWNLQKATVTGYTQPSNQYFATRQRLAYHPPEKRFTGYGMHVDNGNSSSGSSSSPPPPKSSARGSLPKGMSPPPQQTPPPSYTAPSDNTNKDKLAEYEAEYLKRIEQEKALQNEIVRVAEERVTQSSSTSSGSSRGTLPKGF